MDPSLCTPHNYCWFDKHILIVQLVIMSWQLNFTWKFILIIVHHPQFVLSFLYAPLMFPAIFLLSCDSGQGPWLIRISVSTFQTTRREFRTRNIGGRGSLEPLSIDQLQVWASNSDKQLKSCGIGISVIQTVQRERSSTVTMSSESPSSLGS
jgi:hypothetical protein